MAGELRERVRAVVESLCTALPHDCATFFVEDDPSATGGGTIFSLTPWSQDAAPIVVNCIESGITLIVGKESRFELLANTSTQQRRALDDLQEICEAVISGRFSETVWSRGEEVVRVDGRITVGDRTLKTSSRHTLSLFSKKKKATFEYGPYCGIEDDASASA